MKRFEHGGDIYSTPGVLDFSANINPLGLPPGVTRVLRAETGRFTAYPDPKCRELCQALSEAEGVEAWQILCGNGAADLIFRLVTALKPSRALVLAPTFSEYEKALHSCGCQVYYHCLSEENGFAVTDTLLPELSDRTDMVFLCNPNNPVGNLIEPDVLKAVVDTCCKRNIRLVIDECFLPMTEHDVQDSAKSWLDCGVIVLKAFTKLYAMAGLRLGYMICSDRELLNVIADCGQSWSVSVPAQLAGCAALKETEYKERSLLLLKREREYLEGALKGLGLRTFPPAANYILFRCPVPLGDRLKQRGILIRDCSNYIGLDSSYFRVAVRTHTDNIRLVHAVKEALNG